MTRPWLRWLLISSVLVAVAHLLDPFAWSDLRLPSVYERDWGRLLRSVGFLPTWGVIALAYWLQQRGDPARNATTRYLVLSPTVGGLVAEVLKLVFRRLRPDDTTFGYVFRGFADDWWSNRGMGLPSSHALVAFAGAAALGFVFPRARWVFLVLAAGCAITRVLARAHYLSDVTVAACCGIAVAFVLRPRPSAPAVT